MTRPRTKDTEECSAIVAEGEAIRVHLDEDSPDVEAGSGWVCQRCGDVVRGKDLHAGETAKYYVKCYARSITQLCERPTEHKGQHVSGLRGVRVAGKLTQFQKVQ